MVEIRVPAATIVKVLVTAVLVWAALKLLPDFLFFLLALLLAMALSPVVAWLERRGWKRGLAVGVVSLLTVGTILAFLVFVGPPLVSQVVALLGNLPEYRQKVSTHIGPSYPVVRQVLDQILSLPTSPEVAKSLRQPLFWGEAAIVGVTVSILVLTLTLYLVADWKATYAWLTAAESQCQTRRSQRGANVSASP